MEMLVCLLEYLLLREDDYFRLFPSYQQRSSIVMPWLYRYIRHCLAAGSLATTKNDNNAATSRLIFINPFLHVLHNQLI